MSVADRSPLEGTWEMIKSENLDAFLKKKKINFVGRKLANHSKPTLIITKTGEKKWKMKTILNRLIQPEMEAEEGEEFLDTPPIGEAQKCVIRLDANNPNLLHMESRTVGNEADLTIITREVIGEQLVMVCNVFIWTVHCGF